MSANRTICLVPGVQNPVGAVTQLCARRGWPLDDLLDDLPNGVALRFSAGPANLELLVVLDDYTDIPHALIGPGLGQSEVAADVERVLEPFSRAELFSFWDQAASVDDAVAAAYMLGLGAPPEPDSEFADRLIAGLFHTAEAVRSAAVHALGFRRWAPSSAALLSALESERSPSVRAQIEKLLSDWEREEEARS